MAAVRDQRLVLLEQWSDEVDGVAVGEGAFAPGPALWVGTREVAHFADERTLEVRLTKAVIRQRREALRRDERVVLRRGTSDWLEVDIGSPEALVTATGLVRAAVAANRATAPEGLPPTGADLARRRRFH
jgi:hypothetical protein